MRKLRQQIEAEDIRPTVARPDEQSTRPFSFHQVIQPVPVRVFPLKVAAPWQAYLIHRGDGTLFDIENIDFTRLMDSLSGGRIVVVWTSEKQTDFSFHYCEQHSDDDGETWSAIDALNVSTTTPVLGRDFTRYGGVIERNGKILVYSRGLVGTGGDPPARKIYKSVWDGGWTGPALWHSEAGQTLTTHRPARSRDRSVAGVLYLKQQVAAPNPQRFFYAPVDVNGDPTAHEAVTDTTDPLELAVSPALAYDESNNPVAMFIYEPANEIWFKVRNGGWPAAFTKVSIGDPDAPTEDKVFHTYLLSTPMWGGGTFLANGDTHALREDASIQDTVFVHRKRIGGVWASANVNFTNVVDSNPIFSGTGAAWGSGVIRMANFPNALGKAYGVLWMTASGSVDPMTLWLVRRKGDG